MPDLKLWNFDSSTRISKMIPKNIARSSYSEYSCIISASHIICNLVAKTTAPFFFY